MTFNILKLSMTYPCIHDFPNFSMILHDIKISWDFRYCIERYLYKSSYMIAYDNFCTHTCRHLMAGRCTSLWAFTIHRSGFWLLSVNASNERGVFSLTASYIINRIQKLSSKMIYHLIMKLSKQQPGPMAINSRSRESNGHWPLKVRSTADKAVKQLWNIQAMSSVYQIEKDIK